MANVHPTAIIEKGAQLADDVTIGPFCHIGAHVTIESGTTVASHSVISGHTHIGKSNRIFSFASIGTIPQDLKYHGEPSRLIIGDHNIIREYTLFNPGTEGGGMETRIGNHNLFMGYVHLGHDVKIGNHCILANAATLAGHVELGDHVVIGGLSPVHQFVHIGDYAMLAGASALAHDLPPFCMAQGNRAYLRGLNLTGLRRHIPRDAINHLKEAYRQLFLSHASLPETAQRLLDQRPHPMVAQLCRFVLSSKRGVHYKRDEYV